MTLTPKKYFTLVPLTLDMSIRSELYFINEFTFTVAVILSAQATDKQVNKATVDLFKIAPTPEAMLRLGEDGLKEYISSISFFNNKAKNIIGLAEVLSGGVSFIKAGSPVSDWKFPLQYHSREELMKLPGIGQKTANVIMNVLWGTPNIGVDTHVFRNAHRYGWVDEAENTPEKVEVRLLKIIPKKYHQIVNHVMVLHGRYICKALRPLCAKCPVVKWCPARV